MTSINAMRFDDYNGALICDEQRHWNDDRMKMFGADKIRPIIPESIIDKYGLVAAYGNTGTSSIGDELRFKIKQRIGDMYRKRIETDGTPPERFISLEDVAKTVYQVITEVKHDHVSKNLENHFGFTTDDFITGEYTKEGKLYRIKAKEVVDKALEEICGSSEKSMTGPVFGNAGIMAGYSEEEGFQIYLFSMNTPSYEPIPSGFIAQGSGCDLANIHFSEFFNHLTKAQRTDKIDRVDGLIAAVNAVHHACLNNIGVGGYLNIYIVDGKKTGSDRMMEINDNRSKFFQEMVHAYNYGFIEREKLREMVDGLFYQGKELEWATEMVWNSVEEKQELHRFLRGYPGEAWRYEKHI